MNVARLSVLLSALPHLSALHRRRSFTAAAQELGISQSAMSHRLRHLEETLDLSLFRRTSRTVAATASGETLAAAASSVLTTLEQALGQIERRKQTEKLILSVSSCIALKWLVPRLDALRVACPDTDIALVADDRLVDLDRGEADVAIRFSRSATPGLDATRLLEEAVLAVSHPDHAVAAAGGGHVPLLSDSTGVADGTTLDWSAWAARLGLSWSDRNSISFNRTDIMLQAATAGQGMALGRSLLVVDDVTAGFLRPCYPELTPLSFSYWFVCLPERAQDPAIVRLRRWFTDAMSASASELSTFLGNRGMV
jgi:LysR family glycine cleavage system transcriptional activator